VLDAGSGVERHGPLSRRPVRLPGHGRRSCRGVLQHVPLAQPAGRVRRDISVHQGEVTNLPFAPASFTVVMSQHAQMIVADKARLYDEARRVLRPRGRLAIWDITGGAPGALDFPLPWAHQPALSHLVPAARLRARSNLPASQSPTGVT
jgi:SAM-dependent methyltransferase